MSSVSRARAEAMDITRGRGVYLRPPNPSDRREWVAVRSGSRDHLKRYDPRPPRGLDPYGTSGFRALLARRKDATNDLSLICRAELLGQ